MMSGTRRQTREGEQEEAGNRKQERHGHVIRSGSRNQFNEQERKDRTDQEEIVSEISDNRRKEAIVHQEGTALLPPACNGLACASNLRSGTGYHV